MNKTTVPSSPVVSEVEVVAQSQNNDTTASAQTQLLQQILEALQRQNELTEELIRVLGRNSRQRQVQLRLWRNAHPELAQAFRQASQVLQKAQLAYLQHIAEEVLASGEDLEDGQFLLQEFVDRFGPRLAHLNGMLQVFAHLGAEEAG